MAGMNRRSLLGWITALVILLAILGISIAVLVKVYDDKTSTTIAPNNGGTTVTTLTGSIGSTVTLGTDATAITTMPSKISTLMGSTMSGISSTSNAVSSTSIISISSASTTTTSQGINLDCMTKSTLPHAGDNSTFNPFKWGSFRGQLYFGMQTRHPLSPKFGIMWRKKGNDTRNWCEIDPDIRFMWLNSDGQTFGEQLITDKNIEFRTLWINNERSFTAKIIVDSITDNSEYQFMAYLALQDETSKISTADFSSDGTLISVGGRYQPLGDFTFTVSPLNYDSTSFSLIADSPFVEMATVESFLKAFQNGDGKFINTSMLPYSNIVAFQADFTNPTFSIDFSFRLLSDPPMPDFQSTFEQRKSEFQTNFAKIFSINSTDIAYPFLEMGREALSNMLGSISFWHGYSNATGSCLSDGETYLYGPLDLISGVPSRPGFPRGFLWDDGFHNLLIRQFNPDLSLQIIASWLDTMNTFGWIPREMFLTKEAAAKVPPGPWLIEQDDVANPPMLIYVVGKMLEDSTVLSQYQDRLIKLFPRMKLLYTWLKDIQKGPQIGSFQWQGRNATTNLQLNPQTLPSGLDDFPRATHPDPSEYHVDMRCWMAMSSTVMLKLATLANATDWIPIIQADQALFNNLTNLDALHWKEKSKGFFDFGLHSYNVIMMDDGTRHVLTPPEPRFVDDLFGYVNIFPFLLRQLPPDSPKVGIILSNISDPNCLWTEFGLRSVAKMQNGNPARYYDAWNDAGDAPYWRGPIWINMNYFALDALKYYSTSDGPFKNQAQQIYADLRANVVKNMGKVFNETGFIWEHYNDKNGNGEGTRPFTGWSALILAVMADDYR